MNQAINELIKFYLEGLTRKNNHNLHKNIILTEVKYICGLGKGSIKKIIWNFPDLVDGWIWKSPFSDLKKYGLKMLKNA